MTIVMKFVVVFTCVFVDGSFMFESLLLYISMLPFLISPFV